MGGWGPAIWAIAVVSLIIVVPWWTTRWERRIELERIEQEVRQAEVKWDQLHKALTTSSWDLNPGTNISCVVTAVDPVPKWEYVGAVDTEDRGRCYLWRSDDPRLCDPDEYHSIPTDEFWGSK